jgi:hypothetical protein
LLVAIEYVFIFRNSNPANSTIDQLPTNSNPYSNSCTTHYSHHHNQENSVMRIGTRRNAVTTMGACTLLPVVLGVLVIASTTSNAVAFAFAPAAGVVRTSPLIMPNQNGWTGTRSQSLTSRSSTSICRVQCESRLWASPSASATSNNSNNNNNSNEPYVPASLYTADSNDQRYSASDWFHNIMTLPRSSILKEIKGPVLSITLWSALVSIVHQTFLHHNMIKVAKAMTMSNKPHSFLVSALGLLLVFRTNSAYQRFAVRY